MAPGESLTLHVATDSPCFRVVFYRWGARCGRITTSPWLRGADVPAGNCAEDWRWPAFRFDIPRDWRTGVYLAHLETPQGPAFHPALTSAAALFVVRGSGEGDFLYKIPLATYHAYNACGGGCFYFQPVRSERPRGSKVTLRRPGGGIGGDTWGALDHYDPTSPRQTFAHWDARFIRWLERSGYAPDYCADLDLHDAGVECADYPLVVSVGHDEYWSEPARDRMEAYVAAGGNAAFFGANLCWWRVNVVDDGTAMVCHQGGPRGAYDHWWPRTGAHRPEDALTGVSYRHGGGWWDGPRDTRGYVVQDGGHWAFAGTGLKTGEAFGSDTVPPLVGYECDGAPIASVSEHGLATLLPDATHHGTPTTLVPLAVGVLDRRWQELPHRDGYGAQEGVHTATMAVYTRGGTVFTTGTTDWAQVLESDGRVERITRNVLERLGGRKAALINHT